MSDLRERIAKALHEKGAWCGLCSFEGEWDDCADCRKTLLDYADAVLATLDLHQVGWIDTPAPAGTLYEDDDGGLIPVYRLGRQP